MNLSDAIKQLPFALGQIIDGPSCAYPDRLAIQGASGRLTYSQLSKDVAHLQRELRTLGVARFQRWALLFDNTPEFFVALFALARLGAVAAPMLRDMPADRIAASGASADLQGVLYLSRDQRAAAAVDALGGGDETVASSGVGARRLAREAADFTALSEARIAQAPIDVDPALILWSSGSSAASRPVTLQHRALLANMRANVRSLDYRDEDRTLVVLPVTHAYALVHQCLSNLMIGASVYLSPAPVLGPTLTAQLEEHAITTLTTVPPVLYLLVDGLKRRPRTLEHLRLLTVGAAAVAPSLVEAAKQLLPRTRVAITYGLTEAGPRVCTHFVDELPYAAQCVGSALPNVEVILKPVPEGTEITVRGSSIMRGNESGAGGEGADETVDTGDIGELQEGRLYVRGRRRRTINRGGYAVEPQAIVRALLSHPAVLQAWVCSEPHALWGEVPVATVLLDESAVLDAAELHAFCRERLPAQERPARIVLARGEADVPSKGAGLLGLFAQPEEEDLTTVSRGNARPSAS
jgi:acyl-CoA synthetase (AMP-forming)/AMP-acid ligase II